MPIVFLGQVHHVADGRFDGVVPPQILLIVFAFAGDSTITSERAMLLL